MTFVCEKRSKSRLKTFLLTGLSLRAGGRGFSPATKRVVPGFFYWKIEEKIEPKEIPSCWIPRLLVVFNQQLEILVTTLPYLIHHLPLM